MAKEKNMSAENSIDLYRTEPGSLAGRYLRSFWQPVYRAKDLPAGEAVPLRIMSEDFTLYRGESGKPHVVAFRCAHRGTQLSAGWVEDDCIRCFYHGWKYDPSGQCVEQPGEDAAFKSKIKIRSYPTEVYLGLIFAFLGDGAAPSLPRYSELDGGGIGLCGAASPREILPILFSSYLFEIDGRFEVHHSRELPEKKTMRSHAIKCPGIQVAQRFDFGVLQIIAFENRGRILLVVFLQL